MAKIQKYINNASVSNYELALVFQPLLKEDIHKKALPRIYKLVEKFSGTYNLREEDDWGKRHLEYKISGYEEGYFVFLRISISADKVDRFKFELNLEKREYLLRYLLIREDKL